MLYTINYLIGLDDEQYVVYVADIKNLFMIVSMLENYDICTRFVVGTFDCKFLPRDFGFKEFTKWKQNLFEPKNK